MTETQNLQVLYNGVMCPGESLFGGEYLSSSAKNVRIVFQKTGNLVIYETISQKVYWASHTYQKAMGGAFSYLAEGEIVCFFDNLIWGYNIVNLHLSSFFPS